HPVWTHDGASATPTQSTVELQTSTVAGSPSSQAFGVIGSHARSPNNHRLPKSGPSSPSMRSRDASARRGPTVTPRGQLSVAVPGTKTPVAESSSNPTAHVSVPWKNGYAMVPETSSPCCVNVATGRCTPPFDVFGPKQKFHVPETS